MNMTKYYITCKKDLKGAEKMENISEILSGFGIPVSDIRFERIVTGHINDTFKAYSEGSGSAYIIQKVNTDVFKKPDQIMHNIDVAQKYLRSDFKKKGKTCKKIPEYLRSGDKNYMICNGFWRICRYIENVSAKPSLNSVGAFGELLGEFHKCTEKANISELYVTIPGFHNIERNISGALELTGVTSVQRSFFSEILNFYENEKKYFSSPRLVHNDAKWTNVLISPETLLPETLIDYDTIMPGYAAFDFGDAVRSACATETDELDFEMLELFSAGYFREYGSVCAEETAAGILFLTAELSARYLHDFLSGSNYFSGLSKEEKIRKHDKNLKLAKFIFKHYGEIKETISNAAKKIRIRSAIDSGVCPVIESRPRI